MFMESGWGVTASVATNTWLSVVGFVAVHNVRENQTVTYGTSRKLEKIEKAKPVGLEAGLVVRDNFDEMIATTEKWTGGKGSHVVLDLAGRAHVKAFRKLAPRKGRRVLVVARDAAADALERR